MEEETNINNEVETEETDNAPVTETATEEPEQPQDESEEDKYKDVPFNKHPRWQEMMTEREDLKKTTQEMAAQLKSVSETIEKLKSPETTEAERTSLLAELDEKGFESYKDLGDRLYKEFKTRLDEERKVETEQIERISQQNQQEIEGQVRELVQLGELKADEVDNFLIWCADKLEATRSEQFPVGNVKVYADPMRAIFFYKKSQTTPKDVAALKERSTISPSGGSDKPLIKVSSSDVGKMSWGEAFSKR